jgi:hypothetical protein
LRLGARLGDQPLLLGFRLTQHFLHLALRLAFRLIERRRVLRPQSFGLRLDRPGLLHGPLRAGGALADEAQGGVEPQALQREPERDEERHLNQKREVDTHRGAASTRLNYPTRRGNSSEGRGGYFASSECTLKAIPSCGRSSLGKKATFRSFSARPVSVPAIVHWPSKTTPS